MEAKALVETLRDGIAEDFQKHFKTLKAKPKLKFLSTTWLLA